MQALSSNKYKLDEDVTFITDTMEGLKQSVQSLHECTTGVKDFIERQSRLQQQRSSESQRIGAMSRGDNTLVRPTQGRPSGVDIQYSRDTQSWPNVMAENTAQQNEKLPCWQST